MTREAEANALRHIAEGIYMYADALFTLNEQPASVSAGSGATGAGVSPAAVPVVAPGFESSPFDDVPFSEPQPTLADESVEFADQGSEAVCPAHHKPFVDGKFGPYCPNKGIDPAWTNKRGYCTVNPGNVATYLRVKAVA